MKFTSAVITAIVLGQSAFCAEIYDNFTKDGWKRYKSTPGYLYVKKNKLILKDKHGKHAWVTASKTFDVDIDKTPLLVIRVTQLSRKGQVKLIAKKPYQKKPVFSIEKPGIYHVDLVNVCKWKGKKKIEVALYAIGDGGTIQFTYVKFTDKLNAAELAEIKASQKPPKNRKPFELVSLFNSCGYYYVTPKLKNVNAYWRTQRGKWQKALTPVWINEDQMYRGSIVGLKENTKYDFKIVSNNKVLGTKSFTTWNPQVPVAKTIVLNKKNFNGHLKITASGTPKGWIKYTAAPGFVLKNNGKTPLITLLGAKYILLEGLTLQGGSASAVRVNDCLNVRFINCDISGWGRIGVQRFDKDGKYYTKKGRAINNDAGIYLTRSKNTVVERCYFHDPRNTANAWKYSHPAGPEGMMIYKPESTVVRYNDFIGSDQHRWNDAIEGAGNFHKDGGFNRDADIYGNMMTMANDDCIEIDGGQQNVRVFLNKFENALCAVSIQGCMAGPSYVFRNLMINMGDEFGKAGQIIKTSSHYAGKDAVSFIFNNTITGNGRSLPLHRLFVIDAKNNIFAGKGGVGGRAVCKKAITDYNLVTAEKERFEKHGIFGKYPTFKNEKAGLLKPTQACPTVGAGIAIDNFTKPGKVDMGAYQQGENLILPYRPIPVSLDKYQLNYTVKDGKASAAQAVTATIGGKGFTADYKIRKNNVFDWFTVSPASGKLISGRKINFTVKLNPEKMKDQVNYKGVFLIRLKNGFSRPVSIYAKTDIKHPQEPARKGVYTLYIEAEKPSGGKPYTMKDDPKASGGKYVYVNGLGKRKQPAVYTFNISKSGKYYILMRVKSAPPVGMHNSIFFGLDGKKPTRANLPSGEIWIWANASNSNTGMMYLKAHKLKKGKHTISIMPRESISLDSIAITDNPGIFEER
jgi:Right handed beta helix region